MSSNMLSMTPELYTYFRDIAFREHPVLTKLREYTQTLSAARMQISPEQGQLIGFLIKLVNAKKCLELGVFTGYSALCVALNLAEDGKIIACDSDEKITQIAKEYWQQANVMDKIDLRIAPAMDTLNQLLAVEEGSFDFIFIDADKKSYDDYYEASLKLLRSGGIMMIDNIFLNGAVINPEENTAGVKTLRALNHKLKSDPRVNITVLPMNDGITLVCKL